MNIWMTRAGFAAALGFVGLTVVNASWLAETPRGKVRLIAQRGLAQTIDRTGLTAEDCTAAHIEPPLHDYIDNSGPGINRAADVSVRLVEIDLAMTKDGKLVVFGDKTLDCRTNGTGPVSAKTAEELALLDAGYGYTADGGKTFPLRGKGVGHIRTLDQILLSVSSVNSVMFNFGTDNPEEAELLAAALKAAGRDPVERGDGFFGADVPVERIRKLLPDAWAFTPDAAKQCASDYALTGWTSFLPDSCKGGTMLIPVNEQWKMWGWPNKLIARMAEHGGRIIVSGPESPTEAITGLTLPEQLGDIPRDFNGYIWVDDSWTVGPALFPNQDPRTPEQIEAAYQALEKRRER